MSQDECSRLWEAIGEATLVEIAQSLTGTDGVAIEMIGPRGERIWSFRAPPSIVLRDLALAARAHFGLDDQFYSLRSAASWKKLDPEMAVGNTAETPARFRLAANAELIWGVHRPGWPRRLREFLEEMWAARGPLPGLDGAEHHVATATPNRGAFRV